MKLYFGNTVTAVTTIMILALLGFIGESIAKRTNINYWGRRSLFLLVYGLVICCFAAARDGLDKTIQNTIDGSCAPGVFPLISIPNLIGCVGAANYNHCSYCNTDSKVAAYEKDLVLCDVRRNYHEDTGNGNSKDC
jgi:hypothetical protein